MTENQAIVEFLDEYLKKNDLAGLGVAEAGRVLAQAGLLADDELRPGEPLRKLIRDGQLPHAHKVQGRWFIPLSESTEAAEPATVEKEPLSRMKILLRLLYSILFLLVFEVIRLMLQLTVLGEYVYLLIKCKPSKRLRLFGARLSDYSYRVLRFLTLNENGRPYPFAKFPSEVQPPEIHVSFD